MKVPELLWTRLVPRAICSCVANRTTLIFRNYQNSKRTVDGRAKDLLTKNLALHAKTYRAVVWFEDRSMGVLFAMVGAVVGLIALGSYNLSKVIVSCLGAGMVRKVEDNAEELDCPVC